MKLVLTWVCSDDCTYSCDVVNCVEYESEEAFLVDLEQWCLDNPRPTSICGRGFCGTDVDSSVFYEHRGFYDFKIRTLEQWFEDNKVTG